MNRVYKTKWSAAHQQYVVTDEHHATKGKAAKSTLAIAVASIMMATGAQAAYMEPGLRASEILCPWDNRSPPNGCIQ